MLECAALADSYSYKAARKREQLAARRASASEAVPPFKPRQRRYRNMTMQDKQCVVFHRYGSLTDLSRVKMGYADIGRKLHIDEATIRHFLRVFNAKEQSFERLGHRRQKFGMFSDRIKRTLLSPEILEAWQPFSCRERCEIIFRLWEVDTSAKTLACFYRHNNVTYKTTKQAYRRAIQNRAELEVDRREFAVLLGNVLCS